MGNLIRELQIIKRILSSYIEFNKDESKFKKFIEEKNGRENDNRDNTSSPEKK